MFKHYVYKWDKYSLKNKFSFKRKKKKEKKKIETKLKQESNKTFK
jgi:hypothetical protein